MTWRGRLILAIPFIIAATLNVLGIIARPLHWRVEHIGHYTLLFFVPWAWLLDQGWIPEFQNRWLGRVEDYLVVLWIPAALYSGSLWLLMRVISRAAVASQLTRNAPVSKVNVGIMSRSHSLLANIGRVAVLSVVIAVAAWLVGYTYLVKIAGYPSTGFFTLRMVLGLLAVSFALCAMFMLRGFFRRPPP